MAYRDIPSSLMGKTGCERVSLARPHFGKITWHFHIKSKAERDIGVLSLDDGSIGNVYFLCSLLLSYFFNNKATEHLHSVHVKIRQLITKYIK